MDKYILCLANSYKHGGRCIAGIEVENQHGQLIIKKSTYGIPMWIRPVSHTVAGEVPMSDALGIKVLSVIKISDVIYAGNASHSEDYYYSKLETVDTINPSDPFLRKYIDEWHSNIFGNRGRAITPNDFMQGDYSLMLIRTEGCEIYLDQRFTPKPRVKFEYKGTTYDFPITDPIFLDRLRANPSLYKPNYDIVYIVASLAVEHDGWHSKLAATIIFPATDNIKETINTASVLKTPSLQSREQNNGGRKVTTNKTTPPAFTPPSLDQGQTKRTITDVEPQIKKFNDILNEPIFINKQSELQFKKFDDLLNETKFVNKPSIQNTQKSKQGCYIATAVYGSYDCPEVWTLRRYRDYTLAETWAGRLFIKGYYCISPYVVRKYGDSKMLKSFVKPILDRWVNLLKRKGVSSEPYKDRV